VGAFSLNMKGEKMLHCFNYYLTHKNKFIKILADVVSIADNDNLRRLELIYPSVCASKRSSNYDITPVVLAETDFPEIYNREKSEKREYERKSCNADGKHINIGSFYWYLRCSGNFVTLMAQLIVESDFKNKTLINKVYPQMVAAYDLEDWTISPKGFRPDYNAIGSNENLSGPGGLGGWTPNIGAGISGWSGYQGYTGISGMSGARNQGNWFNIFGSAT